MQSRQVSLPLLLETMAAAHYSPIYRLALTFLNDHRAARQAVRETFLKAVLGLHHYRSEVGVDVWIFAIAWRVIQSVRRRERFWRGLENTLHLTGELTERVESYPPTDRDREIWQSVDELKKSDRSLILLCYVNSWSFDRVSKITGIAEAQVSENNSRLLDKIIQKNGLVWEETEGILANSLQARWPPLETDEDELRSFIEQIERRAGNRHGLRSNWTTVKELAIIGLAIILVALLIWGGNRYFLHSETNSTPSGANQESGEIFPGSATNLSRLKDNPSNIPEQITPTLVYRDLTALLKMKSTPSGIYYQTAP